ncbi:glycosyltransferase [Priestia megaterium]|uniref:glycosyltransferase n=1 Tax=Priestia megaterium TaxID=1404 RepID=UPI0036721975
MGEMIKMYIKNYMDNSLRKNQFIFAGRLDKTKGIDKLMKGWKMLCDNDRNAPVLLVCGTGPEKEWCQSFVESNSLEKNIKMLGFVDNKEVIQHISKSKALILPTQWYEGFPVSIVEAYGYGTPVLGSAIGNVGSLVVDGITGYIFDQKYPESIMLAVQKVMESDDKKVNLYKSTFEYYNQHYTTTENYKNLLDIYEAISNSK